MDLIKQWSFSWIGIEVLEVVMLGYDKLLLIFSEGWQSLEVPSVQLSWLCCSPAWM